MRLITWKTRKLRTLTRMPKEPSRWLYASHVTVRSLILYTDWYAESSSDAEAGWMTREKATSAPSGVLKTSLT